MPTARRRAPVRRTARRRNPNAKARNRAAAVVERLDTISGSIVKVRQYLADLREEMEADGFEQTQNMRNLFDHLVVLKQATDETLRVADAVEREVNTMTGGSW